MGYFDFETDDVTTSKYTEDEIEFGLTIPHPEPFLVLLPLSGAKGALLSYQPACVGQPNCVIGSEEFNFDDCNSILSTFGHGGIPIPALGTFYCWLTKKGRMVEFVIDKIENLPDSYNTWRIGIKYVVWDAAIQQ